MTNSEFPRLTDEAVFDEWNKNNLTVVKPGWMYIYARAIESAAREPLLKEIERVQTLAAGFLAERDSALAEATEQARLNGMGSEREAKLMARVEVLEKALREMVKTAKSVNRGCLQGMNVGPFDLNVISRSEAALTQPSEEPHDQ